MRDDDERGFHPRTREGRDPSTILSTVLYRQSFNPRAHEGATGKINLAAITASVFQSTRP